MMAWLRSGGGRGWTTTAAIFALILQMAVAASAHEPLFTGADAAFCHARPTTKADAPSPAAPAKATVCPVCMALAAGGTAVLPPPVTGIALAEVVAPVEIGPVAAVRLAHAPTSTAQPRAPPAIA